MPGLEIIVRPVVFPNIRPLATRSLPPEDDPTQGFASITGGDGQVIDLPYTYTCSMSRSKGSRESARTSDTTRTFQKDENGKINRKNFIDSKVMTRALMTDDDGSNQKELRFRPADAQDNVEIINSDVVDRR